MARITNAKHTPRTETPVTKKRKSAAKSAAKKGGTSAIKPKKTRGLTTDKSDSHTQSSETTRASKGRVTPVPIMTEGTNPGTSRATAEPAAAGTSISFSLGPRDQPLLSGHYRKSAAGNTATTPPGTSRATAEPDRTNSTTQDKSKNTLIGSLLGKLYAVATGVSNTEASVNLSLGSGYWPPASQSVAGNTATTNPGTSQDTAEPDQANPTTQDESENISMGDPAQGLAGVGASFNLSLGPRVSISGLYKQSVAGDTATTPTGTSQTTAEPDQANPTTHSMEVESTPAGNNSSTSTSVEPGAELVTETEEYSTTQIGRLDYYNRQLPQIQKDAAMARSLQEKEQGQTEIDRCIWIYA